MDPVEFTRRYECDGFFDGGWNRLGDTESKETCRPLCRARSLKRCRWNGGIEFVCRDDGALSFDPLLLVTPL